MRILLFADLHIGAIKDTQYVESIFDSILLREVHVNQSDMVVILGDYFDRLFKANEPYVTTAMNCMSKLIRACSNKTAIRIIYGTESHEMNQYNLFSHFLSFRNVNLRIYRTVSEETFHNKSILYIPEEYVPDKHSYYQDTLYSGKKYDFIFGHGTIIDAFPDIVQFSTHSRRENNVPYFTSEELSKASTITAFGHYHIHKDLNNVHYVGSLFRWKFGEEEPKGYAIIDNDDQFHFIPNKDAYVFKTYEIKSQTEEDIRKELSTIEKENPSIFRDNIGGKVRIVFNQDSSPSLYEKIRTNLLRSSQITATMNYKPPSDDSDSTNQEEEEQSELYEIIMSKSIPPIEKIRRFIEDRNSLTISLSDIDSYLKNPLSI